MSSSTRSQALVRALKVSSVLSQTPLQLYALLMNAILITPRMRFDGTSVRGG